MKKKLVFMGTCNFAVSIMEKLVDSNYNLAAVYTQPDRAQNRGLKVSCCPIKNFTNNKKLKNIKISEPDSLSTAEEIKKFKDISPDLVVVAAYGKMIPDSMLKIPKYGFINVHPSLLPKYRGPSPIQTALLNEDEITGISIIKLSDKMDAGDILFQQKLKINKGENALKLNQRLSELSAEILPEVIDNYLDGKIKAIQQDDEKATFTKLIKKSDGHIQWGNNKNNQVIAKMKAYTPWPKVFFYFNTGKKRIKVEMIEIEKINIQKDKPGKIHLDKFVSPYPFAACKKGGIILKTLKPEGKNEMSALDFINGYSSFVGTVLD